MHSQALMIPFTRAADEPFNEILRQRERQVLRIAYRILGNWADAEEVAQETFLRLYRHGTGFPNDQAAGAWLYRVAVNLCVDRSRAPRAAEEIRDVCGSSLSAEGELLRQERKELLMIALGELPAKERAAIVLREIEGLPTAEVAAILGSTEGTIRSQISKAMTKLRALLSKELQ